MSETGRPGGSMRFQSTVWSQVDAAGDARHPRHSQALEQLLREYWRPVFYFVRARGFSAEEAEDLVQEFFFRVCDRHWLHRANPERGRFRTFLLTLLTRFLADQSGQRARRQVRFEQAVVPVSQLLKDEDRRFEPPVTASAESIFLERWVRLILDRVRRTVREECLRDGHADWYDAFEACFLREEPDRLTQVEAAGRFGMTRDQIRYALGRVRNQLQVRIADELRLDGCPADELECEQRTMLELLSATAAH